MPSAPLLLSYRLHAFARLYSPHCRVLCRLLVVHRQAPPRLVSSRIGLVLGPYPLLSPSSARSDDERRRIPHPFFVFTRR
jgi:hypothetical protein